MPLLCGGGSQGRKAWAVASGSVGGPYPLPRAPSPRGEFKNAGPEGRRLPAPPGPQGAVRDACATTRGVLEGRFRTPSVPGPPPQSWFPKPAIDSAGGGRDWSPDAPAHLGAPGATQGPGPRSCRRLRRRPYKERQTALKWMLVTCFGYLGYKNARFGRIEAHEAVTAYGRDKLLTAKEISEAAGYTVLHGLTDCLWVQKPGFTGRGELEGLVPGGFAGIREVKLALKGVYRWIFFMASKQDPHRPVATRYFGVFADGTLKVRGLMCRRRDTPPFVRRAQESMLAKLAEAGTPGELAAMRPELAEMAEGFRQRLREGGINPQELVITRVLSQKVADYKVDTPTALAARQLEPRASTSSRREDTLRPSGRETGAQRVPGPGRAVSGGVGRV